MERLTQRILALIIDGEFPGGHWLREAALAERLGVSRTPVRNAFTELAALGILELTPHRGARIRTYTPDDVEAIYRARAHVEPAVVASAVPQLRSEDLEALRGNAQRMRTLSSDPQARAELAALNNEFHEIFIAAAANQPLAAAARQLLTPLLVARVFAAYSPEALQRSMMHHDELILAAEARDPEWARAIMTSHILAGFHGQRR